MQSITYQQARWLVLALGTVVLVVVAVATFQLGADLVEVVAILLFVPVLVALVTWDVIGGAIAGTIAGVAYTIIRLSTLGELDTGEFTWHIVTRIGLYIAFGVLGGMANTQLEASLKKLELYDEVDDLTGVGNARALLSMADTEAARSRRYQTIFSITLLRIPREPLDKMSVRQAERALRKFYDAVNQAVRTTDKVARVALDDEDVALIIMPETGAEGARIFTDRAVPRATEQLRELGVPLNGTVSLVGEVLTLPGDEVRLETELNRVRALLARDTLAEESSS